jgi:hypothetical protein
MTRLLPESSTKESKALHVHSGSKTHQEKEKRHRYNCGEVGHLGKDCPLPDKRKKGFGEARRGHDMMVVGAAFKMHACKRDNLTVDSGATHHMMTRSDKMFELRPSEITEVEVGGGELHKVELGGAEGPVTIRGVLYVPTLNADLFSTAKAVDAGYSVRMEYKCCQIQYETTWVE